MAQYSATAPRPAVATLQRRRVVISLLALVWLLGSGWLLFQLQTEGQRLFDPTVMTAEDFPLATVQRALNDALPMTGTPLVVHAWDDECACAESAWQHLLSLSGRLSDAGAQVVLLVKPGAEARAQTAAAQLTLEAGIQVAGIITDPDGSLLPASPAAMVVSEGGELVYLGPYAAGGACVTSLGGFVESSLRLVDEQRQQAWVNRAAIGCYCDWRSPASQSV